VRVNTRVTTIAALAEAAAAEIRSRARRNRPLPLLGDCLQWVELDALVSWSWDGSLAPEPTESPIAEVA
jgi:hypothetical protein